MIKNLTLKQWRCVAELTQIEAASKLNVSTTTIFNWETGKSNPSFPTIKKIMELYGIESIDDIRFLSEEKFSETEQATAKG